MAEVVTSSGATVPSQHGKCPGCGADLDGGSIWEHFFQDALDTGKPRGEAVAYANDTAEKYGASSSKGQWGRAIYPTGDDPHITCPDCGHEWGRRN